MTLQGPMLHNSELFLILFCRELDQFPKLFEYLCKLKHSACPNNYFPIPESKIVSLGSDENLSSIGVEDDQLGMIVRTQFNTSTVKFES